MPRNPTWLLDFASNKYSQNGEDGLVAKVLSMLPERDRWCVEFGAWDGVHLSNVRKLLLEDGYSGVLIEGDKARCDQIAGNYAAVSTGGCPYVVVNDISGRGGL